MKLRIAAKLLLGKAGFVNRYNGTTVKHIWFWILCGGSRDRGWKAQYTDFCRTFSPIYCYTTSQEFGQEGLSGCKILMPAWEKDGLIVEKAGKLSENLKLKHGSSLS